MADTPAPSYSAGAQKAAAGTPGCTAGGCPACAKAGLPVLLVRPGLAESSYAQPKQEAARPLLDRHTAEAALSYSRYAMRTLRAGFVVVFYEKPHTPQLKADKGWQIFRVSDGGYLSPFPLQAVPYTNSASSEGGFVCQRSEAYANAMLLVIPEAKLAGSVWVGYSDHPWSQPVRDLYASKEDLRKRRMTLIEASKGTAKRSMPLTTGTILTLVADYDEKLQPNDLLGTPFPPLSMQKGAAGKAGVRPESALDVFQAAERLVRASQGQYTMDHVHMVSVPDAVGVTSESAYMRLVKCNSAARWLNEYKDSEGKKQGQWRLQTALTIEGLLKEIDAQGDATKRRIAGMAHLNGKAITSEDFRKQKAAGSLPPEARWVGNRKARPMSRVDAYPDPINGKIELPNEGEIDHDTAGLKDDVLEKLGSGGRYPFRSFLEQFDRLSKADKDLLSKIEPDHGAWLNSAARKLVTEHDFGLNERIDGLHYANAVAQITLGGHMSTTGLEWYKPFASDNPHDSQALLTRALLGNQLAFFDAFKPTKIHKETKNIFKLFEETAQALKDASAGKGTPLASQVLLAKYPFYDKVVSSLPLLKNAASGLAHPLITIVGGISMATTGTDPASVKTRQFLTAIMQCITAGTAGPSGAMAQTVKMTLSEAVKYWESLRGELGRRAAQGAGAVTGAANKAGTAATGKLKNVALAGGLSLALAGHSRGLNTLIDVWIFTAESADDLTKKATVAGRSAANAAAQAGRSAGSVATAAGRAIGSATAPATQAATRAAGWTAAQLSGFAKGSAAVMSGGAASFSAAGAVLHGFSIAKSVKMLENGTQDQRTAAWFGLAGSGLGITGASLEVAEQVAKANGAWASKANMLKLMASRLSAAGLFVDAGLALTNGWKRMSNDDRDASRAYFASGAFFALAGGAGLMAAGQISGTVASAGLLGLSWTGWGLILIGLAIGVGYIAMLLQDTPTEEWAAKTIWGRADTKWGSLEVEQQELNKLLMGIRVEFEYGMNTMATTGAGMSRANGGLGALFVKDPFEGHSGLYKTVELKLWMPKALRDSLEWTIGITLGGRDGISTLVYMLGRSVPSAPALSLKGLERPQRSDEGDLTHITIDTDGLLYPRAQVQVQVLVDATSGDYVVDQTMTD
ncbi:hypothetical protein GmRootV118_63960 [Variovorax sp. V118]|uniref:T6SS effector BTH_I2691 family protein n=1 Tax=Variovorax sp. V118 TaxID=3065954 RepID=UPI0034E8E0CE